MEKEIFKDIPGYEGIYQVSNMGNVKSLIKNVKMPNGGIRMQSEKILKHTKSKRGYYLVVLYKDAKPKGWAMHVLVAMAFLGHIPDGTQRIVLDHKDGNKLNNCADNIELVTNRQNVQRYWLTQKTSSKYIGVNWCKKSNKWQSQIYIDGKKKFLGYFADEHDAHLAYQKALKELK
jgi:hypothetical protein